MLMPTIRAATDTSENLLTAKWMIQWMHKFSEDLPVKVMLMISITLFTFWYSLKQ